MEHWKVQGRYHVWDGTWRVKRTNVPDLSVEAPTREMFAAAVERHCEQRAAGTDYELTVEASRSYWVFTNRFMKRVLVNGRLVSRDEADRARARYEAAG